MPKATVELLSAAFSPTGSSLPKPAGSQVAAAPTASPPEREVARQSRVLKELLAARNEIATLQAAVKRQAGQLARLKGDLHAAHVEREALRAELRQAREMAVEKHDDAAAASSSKAAADGGDEPWEGKMLSLCLTASPAQLDTLEAEMRRRLESHARNEEKREREWLLRSFVTAKKGERRAEEEAARSRHAWSEQRQASKMRSQLELSEARARKDQAKRDAAAARRLATMRDHEAEAKKERARASLTAVTSGTSSTPMVPPPLARPAAKHKGGGAPPAAGPSHSQSADALPGRLGLEGGRARAAPPAARQPARPKLTPTSATKPKAKLSAYS